MYFRGTRSKCASATELYRSVTSGVTFTPPRGVSCANQRGILESFTAGFRVSGAARPNRLFTLPAARGNMCDMIGSDERDTLIAGLRSELAREQGKLRALQDIGQALGNTLDVEELVTVLLTRVSRI